MLSSKVDKLFSMCATVLKAKNSEYSVSLNASDKDEATSISRDPFL